MALGRLMWAGYPLWRVRGKPRLTRDPALQALPRNPDHAAQAHMWQLALGHEHVGTTMAYVQPSDRYIERCYQQALQQRLSKLGLGRQEA